jgi:hypothetical protein
LDKLTEVDEKGNPMYFHGARYKVLGYLINYEKYADKIENTL